MPNSVTIYGSSDDLIEVEGDISEEFGDPAFHAGAYVYVSTGDVLRFTLRHEGWRAEAVVDASGVTIEHLDGEDDRVTVSGALTGYVSWVVATTTAPAR